MRTKEDSLRKVPGAERPVGRQLPLTHALSQGPSTTSQAVAPPPSLAPHQAH